MPNSNSKSRQDLRSRFVRNAIPSEADFADLIAAGLNQADDGVLKLPDQPLGLVRQKPDQPVLRFYADPAAEGSAWQLQLGTGDKPSFSLAAADGKPALFVDGATGNVGIGATASATVTIAGNLQLKEGLHVYSGKEIYFSDNGQIRSLDDNHRIIFRHTENKLELREYGDIIFSSGSTRGQETSRMVIDKSGNVGIGTVSPGSKLSIKGNVNESKDPESAMTNGGQLTLKGDAPQIDFIDINHNDWSIHVNSNKMYFIRQPWEYTDLVLDGGGKVGIGTAEPQAKLQIVHANQDSNGGALILGPTDQSNLRLGYNLNYSWIQSHGNKPLSINSIGNRVGIGTDNPSGSLHVVVKDSGIFFEFPGKGTWVFQSDGNLVKYRVNGSVAWALNNFW
jgi:hypothetical protein